MIDFGMNVQEAGDAARWYHSHDSEPTGYVMEDGGLSLFFHLFLMTMEIE
jgi:gamma-glutamyltranspeptidase